jgi:hypothetical protein
MDYHVLLTGDFKLLHTAAHIMSSIEVLWNEASAIEAVDPVLLLSEDDIYHEKTKPPHHHAPNAGSNAGLGAGFVSFSDLGKRVEQASQSAPDNGNPVAPDDAINRIKDVTRLRPTSSHEVDTASPEYLFGESFTNLVRHIVVDYLDKSVEPIIREAITTEMRQIAKNKNKKS